MLGRRYVLAWRDGSKLVTPEAANPGAWRERQLEVAGHRFQRGVAGGMPGIVVQGLEVVQIDIEQSERLCHRALDRICERLVECGAVEHSGQRIVCSCARENALLRLLVRDIADCSDEPF
jgi:hypothetical protein